MLKRVIFFLALVVGIFFIYRLIDSDGANDLIANIRDWKIFEKKDNDDKEKTGKEGGDSKSKQIVSEYTKDKNIVKNEEKQVEKSEKIDKEEKDIILDAINKELNKDKTENVKIFEEKDKDLEDFYQNYKKLTGNLVIINGQNKVFIDNNSGHILINNVEKDIVYSNNNKEVNWNNDNIITNNDSEEYDRRILDWFSNNVR